MRREAKVIASDGRSPGVPKDAKANTAAVNHRRHVFELDGLRAIAVTLVLITHLFGDAGIVPRSYFESLPRPLSVLVTHGWLGVDLFFVLSGFLITSILLGRRGSADYFRDFYRRRALRILPVYLVVIAVLALAYGMLRYGPYWLLALGFAANLSPLLGLDVPKAAGPMWSLAVEEQFYLFWPVVVMLLDRRTLAVIAAAIVAAEPFVRYGAPAEALAFPWERFDGLAVGALLAVYFSYSGDERRRWPNAALVLGGLAIFVAVATAPAGGFAEGALSRAVRISEGVLAFGAIVALVVGASGHRAFAFLRSRVARTVANLSFCVYLIHVGIIELFDHVVARVDPAVLAWDPARLAPFRAAVVVVVALGVAGLSRRYLELPFLNRKSRSSTSHDVAPAADERAAVRVSPVTPVS